MKLIGICRLGRDAEIRYTHDGTPVANIAGAFNYGRKDEQGKRPTQWVELSLWGERAEGLSQYLTKGRQLYVIAGDVHVETYSRNDGGQGVKLVGKVESVEFVGSAEGQQVGQQAPQGGQRAQAPAPAPAPRQQRQAAPAPAPARQSSGFDDMDDDIPF